jgi:hypothetical protein
LAPEDRVRLSKAKRTFKKGYLPNWTEELFTVVKCIETSPPVYLVNDDHGEILEGTFYAKELQKVIKTDDVYKIETILKREKRDEKFSIWSSGLDIQSSSTAGSLKRTYKAHNTYLKCHSSEWHRVTRTVYRLG